MPHYPQYFVVYWCDYKERWVIYDWTTVRRGAHRSYKKCCKEHEHVKLTVTIAETSDVGDEF